jgi:hypothetical protein
MDKIKKEFQKLLKWVLFNNLVFKDLG